MLLAADSASAAAGDLVRGERSRRAGARVLLVAAAGAVGGRAAGARLRSGRRRRAPARRSRRSATRSLLPAASTARSRPPATVDEGHIALLGAGGGMGTTTCAVALASVHERAFVLDLALATGDAAEVAAARVAVPDALLRIALRPRRRHRPSSPPGSPRRPAAACCPAPSLPEHADLIDEHGIARVLDLARASGLRAIVDCGSRLGVETIPALERARADRDRRERRCPRRARSAPRVAPDRPPQPRGSRARRRRHGARAARARPRPLADQAGLPLLAAVRADARVPRARERGVAPPRRRVRARSPRLARHRPA